MALDFLNTGSSGFNVGDLSNLFNLGGQISGVNNTFKGYQPTSAETGQAQSIVNQNALLQAYLDTNSTIFKNLNAGNQQYLNSQTQQGLNNLMQMNRKAQLMGRATYFNPERQDEAISQFMSKQGDANANTARNNTLQNIMSAINGYGSNAANYGSMIKNQQNAQNINRASTGTALSGIGSMLGNQDNLSTIMKFLPMLMA